MLVRLSTAETLKEARLSIPRSGKNGLNSFEQMTVLAGIANPLITTCEILYIYRSFKEEKEEETKEAHFREKNG